MGLSVWLVFLFLGRNATMSSFRYATDPVVDRADAYAKPFGDLFLPHATQYQLNRLSSRPKWNDGLGRMVSIPEIRRQLAFQTLPGRIDQTLDHLGRGHRRGEIQFHRPLPFLGTEHTKILSFSLQENVHTPLPPLTI